MPDPRRMLDQAERMLDDILSDHENHLDEAEGFGLRVAKAPRGLMPLAEAQRIIDSFDKDTEKLRGFLAQIGGAWGRSLPDDLAGDYRKLVGKAEKALGNFEKDRVKAQAAVEKWESLLVGEHFQAAFQAVRMAVLAFDPEPDIDVDFKTDLHLNADPAYAVGAVPLSRGGKVLFKVFVGYKAATDRYWGNIYSGTKNHTFKEVVGKSGPAHLSKFVKELVGQLKALDDVEGAGVFHSRKKVVLKLKTPDEIRGELLESVSAKLKGLKPISAVADSFMWEQRPIPKGDGATGTFKLNWRGYQDIVPAPGTVKDKMLQPYRTRVRPLSKSYKVRGKSGTQWVMTLSLKSLTYMTKLNYKEHHFTDLAGLQAIFEHAPEYLKKLPPIGVLRERAQRLRVNVSDITRSKKDVAARIREFTRVRSQLRPDGLYWKILMTVDLVPASVKASSDRVAQRFLNAGGQTFEKWVQEPDAKKAFRKGYREVEDEYGHQQGYSGHLNTKNGYTVRHRDPMTVDEVSDFIRRDIDNNDKGDAAFAVPYCAGKVLGKDTVKVVVKARNEKDALRRGVMMIKATGRIPPKASIVVEKPKAKKVGGGKRVAEWEVTGLRKQVVLGRIDGWVFYGWASS
jgi:hypothetical protein